MKPLQLPRRSVDSQSANRMLRKAAVVGTFEVANGECVVRLSNVMHPHAFASTCPTATDGVSVPAPKPETLIHDIQNGTIVVHESKRSITKKQLAVHINYLQTGANVARGTSGVCVCVWNRGLQEPTPASTSPAPTPSIDKPVASSSSSSSSGSEEQSESEAAESDTDASTSSDHARKPSENAKDIAKDDDQKPSQNNQAGHLDDVCQVE